MLEKLAALQHEIWSHWMKYLFQIAIQNEDGSVTIPVDKVTRWKRQMDTEYSDLFIEEKKSDIEQAMKVINLLGEELGLSDQVSE